jgi:hypothetical protein
VADSKKSVGLRTRKDIGKKGFHIQLYPRTKPLTVTAKHKLEKNWIPEDKRGFRLISPEPIREEKRRGTLKRKVKRIKKKAKNIAKKYFKGIF